jgi:hypothetical protein
MHPDPLLLAKLKLLDHAEAFYAMLPIEIAITGGIFGRFRNRW